MIIILIVNSFLSAGQKIYENDHANGVPLPSSRAGQNETMSWCVARLSWAWVGGRTVNKKNAPPSPGSNSEDGANDMIGRFLLVGLTSPMGVSNLRCVAARSKNVAHLGGTVFVAGHLY